MEQINWPFSLAVSSSVRLLDLLVGFRMFGAGRRTQLSNVPDFRCRVARRRQRRPMFGAGRRTQMSNVPDFRCRVARRRQRCPRCPMFQTSNAVSHEEHKIPALCRCVSSNSISFEPQGLLDRRGGTLLYPRPAGVRPCNMRQRLRPFRWLEPCQRGTRPRSHA